jgi:microcin C transport system permease protein
MAVIDTDRPAKVSAPAPAPAGEPPSRRRRVLSRLRSPINQRRWQNFKANRRGFWSLWIFLFLFGFSCLGEFFLNDRPILVSYKGELLYPILVDYPESKFGGFLATTDYRDTVNQNEINENGWMIWPLINRYSYNTFNFQIPGSTPSPPWWLLPKETLCEDYALGLEDPNCTVGNLHWLGSDDQGRDVLSRLVYGFRLSVAFGLILAVLSSIIGVIAGAVQGYFGGRIDLYFQRFMEIWDSVPTLYLLIILSAFIQPDFWWLLGIMLLFQWMSLVGVVRAEFLRARNFDYVRAARAMGASSPVIMFRHVLPNAMVATISMLPFLTAGSVTALTALDFLGFGLPPGSASLGELVKQGKEAAVNAPWLGITAFFVLALMLTLLVFIGEAVRDAFDPRKSALSAAPAPEPQPAPAAAPAPASGATQ